MSVVLKWLLYLALLAAAGFGAWALVAELPAPSGPRELIIGPAPVPSDDAAGTAGADE